MRTTNLILSFLVFFLAFYLYGPAAFSNPEVNDTTVLKDDLDEQIRRAVEQKIEAFKNQELPLLINSEVAARLKERDEAERKLEKKRKAAQKRKDERFYQNNPDLRGRMAVAPYQSGAWGVKFDLAPGQNGSTDGGAQRLNVSRANIAPFIRVREWGAEMSVNLRKMLQNEVIKGELRDQVSNQDLESAYVYYRAIDNDQVEMLVYLGQVPEPFIRTVFDQTVFNNLNILDKYNLNGSMAVRVDVGFGQEEGASPSSKERQIWVQAAAFNMDGDTGTTEDLAIRVVASLSILNRFSDWNFKPFEVWGGIARVNSGATNNGETDEVTDPDQNQKLAVFGMKIDLEELTGMKLGKVYGEFVRRVKTGKLTDQSWVVGWDATLTPSEEGKRPIELGARIQNQQDDPDSAVADGKVASFGMLLPLVEYNVGLRLNFGYVFDSTDPERDGEVVLSYDFEVIF